MNVTCGRARDGERPASDCYGNLRSSLGVRVDGRPVMSNLIKEIDARTRLAGANQMELLLFKLGTNEIYGINVFKVREVMKLPALTQIPEADSRIVGMANIRGTMVPVVGLRQSLGLGEDSQIEANEAKRAQPYLIISEYN